MPEGTGRVVALERRPELTADGDRPGLVPCDDLSAESSDGTRPGPRRRRRAGWRWAAWIAVLVTLGMALAAGSGAFGGAKTTPPSLYERTLQVAGQYRCPVCQGESAAASDTPASVEIRSEIRSWLQKGWNTASIRTYMVDHYGSSILERPPSTGAGALVWAIPAVALIGALGALAFAFRRWQRADVPALQAPAVPGFDAPAGPPAVDVSTKVPAADHPPAPGADRRLGRRLAGIGRSRAYQRASLVGGVALVLVATGLWFLDRSSAPRVAGQPVTGGATGITAELDEAALMAPKDPLDALLLYEEVLRVDPDQPVALTAEGWIDAQAGSVTQGLSLLAKAEAADPSYGAPHLYRGLALLDWAHRPQEAETELTWYLGHAPVPSQVAIARTALASAKAEVAGTAKAKRP